MTLNDKFGPTFHEKGSQDEFIQHPVQSPPLIRDHITPLGRLFPWVALLTLKKFLLYQADPSPGATCHSCILHVDPCEKENLHPLSDHSFSTGIVWWGRHWGFFSPGKNPFSLQFFFTAPIVHPFDDFHGPPFDLRQSGLFFPEFWAPGWDTR